MSHVVFFANIKNNGSPITEEQIKELVELLLI